MCSMIIVTEGGRFLRQCSLTDLRALLTEVVCFQMTAVEFAIEFWMGDFMENLLSVIEQDLKTWGQRAENCERIGRCTRKWLDWSYVPTSDFMFLRPAAYSFLVPVSQIMDVELLMLLYRNDFDGNFILHAVLYEGKKLDRCLHHEPIHTILAALMPASIQRVYRGEALWKYWYLITLVANCKQVQDHVFSYGVQCEFLGSRDLASEEVMRLSVSTLEDKKPAGCPVKLCVIVDERLNENTQNSVNRFLRGSGVSVCTFNHELPFEPNLHPESRDCSVVFVIAMSGINTGDMDRISTAFPQNIPYVSIDMEGESFTAV